MNKPAHAPRIGGLFVLLTIVSLVITTNAQALVECGALNTVTANVVVLDQPVIFNRMGAQNPTFITYALRRDVIDDTTGLPEAAGGTLTAGAVSLRPDKRPRPLTVRVPAENCLRVNFQNLLGAANFRKNEVADPVLVVDDQVADRHAGFHPLGLELVGSLADDASNVGLNGNSLVLPGNSTTYTFYAPQEGAFAVTSYGATIGGDQTGGNHGSGMFAMVAVEPVGARMYRGQLTEEERRLATTGTVPVDGDGNPGGQPILDYEVVYPAGDPWFSEGKAGLPVINMLRPCAPGNASCIGQELVHGDINAIIVGPNADGTFPPSTYPLESVGKRVPSYPNRLEPFREFASIYHDEQSNSQAWPLWYQHPVFSYTLAGVRDGFMINYGSGGVGSEIIANRLHTGPMHDCTGCAYEEFFLSSSTVGDPAQLVAIPANAGIEACTPDDIAGTCFRDPVNLANGPIPGNEALFQADGANVHHAYTGDFVKYRNVHVGVKEQHIFHQHNHQWLLNPNDDNANYLDAQVIMPGSGHTYELVNGGAGNRNRTAGDAIFHCHFYPHFAQGMWYHLRTHDVTETGTLLAVSVNDDANQDGFHDTPFALRSGRPAPGSRALPDGELPDGSPIPAVVPLPGKPMAPMPGRVEVVAVDRGGFSLGGGRTGPDTIPDASQVNVIDRDINPGYPFWIAGLDCGGDPVACPDGIVGQRLPTPPLDMLTEAGALANGFNPNLAGGWDGGLPRHSLLGYTAGGLSVDTQNRLDFSKIVERVKPVYYSELGTDLELVAMAAHAQRAHPSVALDLAGGPPTPGDFILNGTPVMPGSPYNNPCVDDAGTDLTSGVLGEYFDGNLVLPGGLESLTTRGRSAFSSENPRTFKMANIQIDAVFNKVGYHYPQQRIIALWEDVIPTITKVKPPEPLVMRFNTFDCGKLLHTNLVPNEYQLDDFQVRTPTDIIGQHIHLPKWDLTTNDGAANGWNYEDGTLSPGAVAERIHAINVFNLETQENLDDAANGRPLRHPDIADLLPVPTPANADPDGTPGGLVELTALPHPFFSTGPFAGTNDYLGARTTIQRLYEDPVVNVAGVDRGLGITFSHDHYGPSTFQQIGLYSTIITEPAGSTWLHNESGQQLYTRPDGGPTSWQAVILPPVGAPPGNTVKSEDVPDHREFYFEFSDFQHAYQQGTYVGADADGRPDPVVIVPGATPALATAPGISQAFRETVNPPNKVEAGAGFPDIVEAIELCPGGVPRPCAEAINIAHSAMLVTNYRNEPVGLRVFDPAAIGPDGRLGAQTAEIAGDLAFALQTRTDRAIGQLNTRFGDMPYPQNCLDPNAAPGTGDGINCDRRPGDPITPIMRAYSGDQVKIKVQSGATEEEHQVSIHGMKWLSNGSGFGRSPNSGWRNFQASGISEQFSLQTPVNADIDQDGIVADYLYNIDTARDGWWSGTWGVLRSYSLLRNDLHALPENPPGINDPLQVVNEAEFDGVCPLTAPQRIYDVTAVLANDVLPNALGATIFDNIPAGPRQLGVFVNDNEGGPLNPAGGTLVNNPRATVVPPAPGCAVDIEPCPPGQEIIIEGGEGPLHDPTGMMYVRTGDLVVVDGAGNPIPGADPADLAANPFVRLKATAPVEPLVLRANPGDCLRVMLRNRLPEVAPDLAGWQSLQWVVTRDTGLPGQALHFFDNNLVRPSTHVGLTPQLVEYDVTKHDGANVGINPVRTISPGGSQQSTWYVGDIRSVSVGIGQAEVVATPVEFGGTNLMPPDKVKQGQKGLFGGLVIEPVDAVVTEDTAVADRQDPAEVRRTRANVTVFAPPGAAGSGGTFREAVMISQKGLNLRWADGRATRNLNQGELGREGTEDSGHMSINYGGEPAWFRFGLRPDAPFGNAGTPNSFGSIPNANELYSNALVALEPNTLPDGDPATPVFTAAAGEQMRLRMLIPFSTDRDSTFILHGHGWQRDPFVCPGQADLTLPGRCDPNEPVPSQAIGINPQGKYMGGEEGMGLAAGHWEVYLPSAGGTNALQGDFLFRDYASSGNANGLWGLMRTANVDLVTDTDADGIPDISDNCQLVSNGPATPGIAAANIQRDTDGDGIGNICDPDLTNNGAVNVGDLTPFQGVFPSAAPGVEPFTLSDHADFNGDGAVNVGDLTIFQNFFPGLPGPSCCAL